MLVGRHGGDEARMRHYLGAIAQSDRSQRTTMGYGLAILGIGALGAATYPLLFDGGVSQRMSAGLGVLGGLAVAGGL